MKLLNKIHSLGRKGKIALASLTVVASVVAIPVVHAQFFPDRPTFDYNKFDPNNLNCDDPNNPAAQNGRCGSMTGPVFNSFINTPFYGDERPFFDGRISSAAPSTTSDPITNVDQNGQEVTLRVFVHNNANQGTDCLRVHLDVNGNCTQIDNNAVGIAHNTKVSIALPTTTAQVERATAEISASNAATVGDTVDMTSSEPFSLSYVPGSAVLLRGTDSTPLNDSIVNGGALIGDKVMNGDLPGCFQFAAFVEIKVKINVQPPPNLQVTKQVKINGGPTWNKEVAAKPGDDIKWMIGTKDISNANLNNVIARDVLPPHLQVVPGSIKLYSGSNVYPLDDHQLFVGGFNIGNYVPGSLQFITFDTIAQSDFPACSVLVTNIAHARSDQTPAEVTDTANASITKQNCQPPPHQTLTCDMLTATKGDNRTVTFAAQATANGGADIVFYHYDFGDNTPVLTTDKTSVSHTYASDGQFAARLSVEGHVNGNLTTVTSDKCAVLASFTTPPPTTPSTPVTPASSVTTLVNTGPGSVAALFAVATVAGSVVYHTFLSRRLTRQ